MSTYARIKQTVTTRQAAERYGLPVNRSGMVKCPFHEDHNPSMKVPLSLCLYYIILF